MELAYGGPIYFRIVNSTNQLPEPLVPVGNITAEISVDAGARTLLEDPGPVPRNAVEERDGSYRFDIVISDYATTSRTLALFPIITGVPNVYVPVSPLVVPLHPGNFSIMELTIGGLGTSGPNVQKMVDSLDGARGQSSASQAMVRGTVRAFSHQPTTTLVDVEFDDNETFPVTGFFSGNIPRGFYWWGPDTTPLYKYGTRILNYSEISNPTPPPTTLGRFTIDLLPGSPTLNPVVDVDRVEIV